MADSSKLARLIRWLIYAAAFVPLLIFSQFLSPFHFGKVIVFRALVEIILVLYVLLIWKDKTYRPKSNPILWSFFAFALAFSLTTAASVDVYQSFWGTLERMGGMFTFWHYFVFYLVLTSVFRTRSDWFRFLRVMISVGILSALYGFGQKTNWSLILGSGGRSRIFGTIGNPALFAGYQIIIAFLSLTLFIMSDKRRGNDRLLFGAGFILPTIAVLMTAVRGSLLGLGIGLLLFTYWYMLKSGLVIAKKVFRWLVIIACFFVLLSFGLRNTDIVQNSGYLKRVTDFSLTSQTVKTRFWAWQAGLKGWIESPKTVLLGWGPDNFNTPFSKYFNPKFFQDLGSETLFDRAHNMFIEVLVTMGLLGLIAYLSIFVFAFKALNRIKKDPELSIYGIGLAALIVAYMIHNSFIFDTSANFIAFFSVLGFLTFLSKPKEEAVVQELVQEKRVNPALYAAVAGFMFAVVFTSIYKYDILTAKANYTTTRGIVAGWNDDFSGAVADFEKAITYNLPGKYEIRHQFAQYLIDYSASKIVTPQIEDAMKVAIDAVQKNANENPHDYLPELYLSRMNIILGKADPKSPYNDIALQHSMKALAISPTFIRTYFEIGQAYLNKKDYQKAIEYFQKAADLNPDAGVSFWYWGMTEIQIGNVDVGLGLVSQAIQKGYSAGEQDYLKVLDIYIQKNDNANIALIYEKLIAIKPDNPQYHAALAVAYARLGRIDDAVNQALEAAKVDPSYTQDAQAFIKNLGR